VVPWLGRVFCGDRDTHAYILDSLERYPEAEEIGSRMERAGWERVSFWRLLGGVMTIHRGYRSAAV
ncbi:MAG: class I SAM-dependent methyltransferase, partial [Nitrospira sp.]|nr:class I SAM-dependent methyltransferase [Nitrospira sp.]